MCFDATRRRYSYGRLLNHSIPGNVKPFRPLFVRNKWRIGFMSMRHIRVGEVLVWDYACPPEGNKWLYRRAAKAIHCSMTTEQDHAKALGVSGM